MDQKFIEAGQTFGTRIPKAYFTATGCGETDLGAGVDPWETGAYDLALLDAGIENYNIVQYSSVMPKECVKHERKDIEHLLHHGAVLETIMANINGVQGDHLCAGVLTAHVRDKDSGESIGGFACEYEGHAKPERAKKILLTSMQGLIDRRFPKGNMELFNEDYIIADMVVEKKFGTAIAFLGFVSYLFPVVDE